MSTNFAMFARLAVLGAVVATPALAQDKAKDELQKCDRPFGTIALAEPLSEYMQYFNRYSLGSPTALLRVMVQQSKCFVVLERGNGMAIIKGERELARDGEAQAGSNMGGGQMVLADFVMNPALQVVDNNAGGVGGALGGIGRRMGGLAAVAGGVKFKEASTTITIADTRTSVQVASADGKAKKTDFSLGMFGWAGGVVGGAGAYTSTAEGKIIASSYLDNYNNVITAIKADPAMVARQQKFDASKLVSGDATKAGATYAEGDVLGPKIDNIKLLATPSDAAKVNAVLKKTDDLVFLGEEKDGFLKVQGSSAEGWVKKTLVSKK
jgi:curli biogenesis system outer membrane secretion channel CsgG